MQAADYQECGPIMQQRPAGLVRSHHAAMASRTGAVPSCSSGQPGWCGPIMQQRPAGRVRNLTFFGFRIRFFVVPDHRNI